MARWLIIPALAFAVACGGNSAEKAQTPEQEKAAALAAGATYWCPMHHEVHSDKAGECSKCGMALVKIEPEAAKP